MKRLWFLLIPAFLFTTPISAKAASGRIVSIHGSASVLRQGDIQWSQISSSTAVHSGDRWIVHPNSHLRVELQEGSWIDAGPHSDLIVQQLTEQGMEWMLLLGSVRVQTGPETSQVVRTASAAIYVEGSSRCLVTSDEFSQTAVKVEDGRARTVYNDSTVVLRSGDAFIGGGRQSEGQLSSLQSSILYPPQNGEQATRSTVAPALWAGELTEGGSAPHGAIVGGTRQISTFGVFAWPFGAFWLPVLGHHHGGKFHPKRPFSGTGCILPGCPTPASFCRPDARTRIIASGRFRSFSNPKTAPLMTRANSLQPSIPKGGILRSNPKGPSRFHLMRQGIRKSFSNYRSNMMRRPFR